MVEFIQKEMKMKRALVVEGGAMRGVFAAGVLDKFMEHDYHSFDFAIGVSAGATNTFNLRVENAWT